MTMEPAKAGGGAGDGYLCAVEVERGRATPVVNCGRGLGLWVFRHAEFGIVQ